ncbi:MAG TPA: GNAT family N-acetyltransferase [Gaiellaceae bacterium]|nr:GNAT family N-acetyltransferase [Gaiellaceae bacterium]
MRLRLERPSTEHHFERWAVILKEVSGDVFDVDEIAHFVESDTESAFLLALDGDEALGCGVGRPSSVHSSLYAMARVLPEHRNRGVGSQLYEALSAHAKTLARDSLWGRVREDDDASRRFVRNRGFREAGREYEVVLDTAAAGPSAEPPEGIRLVSLVERPDLEPAVHEVDCEVAADVPRPEGDDFEPQPFARWREQYLVGPGAMPEAMIAALDGDEVVGYTGLRRRGASSPIAENMLTAVRRPWRRRGIATALKNEQVARARAAGIERIFTTNDETNTGMRGVNALLGYQPAPAHIVVSGPLA